jgi:uncharacterized protein YggU (UPF0235/DUF167 family)
MDGAEAWQVQAGGLALRVRVTPRGGRDAVDGIETLSDGRTVLKVRVRAAPEGGDANEAVRRVLAKALDCAPSAVTLRAGATARVKTFVIAGEPATHGAVLARLAKGRR